MILMPNTTVATNGQTLAFAAGGTVKVYNSLDDTPPISDDSKAFKLGDQGAVSKTIGLTPSDPMRYAVGDQYKIWYFDAEGTKLSLIHISYVYRGLRTGSDIGITTAVGLFQSAVGLVMVIATNLVDVYKRQH